MQANAVVKMPGLLDLRRFKKVHIALDIDRTTLDPDSTRPDLLYEVLVALLIIHKQDFNGEIFINTHRGSSNFVRWLREPDALKMLSHLSDEKKKQYHTHRVVQNVSKFFDDRPVHPIVLESYTKKSIAEAKADFEKLKEVEMKFDSTEQLPEEPQELHAAYANKVWQYLLMARHLFPNETESNTEAETEAKVEPEELLLVFDDVEEYCNGARFISKLPIWPRKLAVHSCHVTILDNSLYYHFEVQDSEFSIFRGAQIKIPDLLKHLPSEEKELAARLQEMHRTDQYNQRRALMRQELAIQKRQMELREQQLQRDALDLSQAEKKLEQLSLQQQKEAQQADEMLTAVAERLQTSNVVQVDDLVCAAAPVPKQSSDAKEAANPQMPTNPTLTLGEATVAALHKGSVFTKPLSKSSSQLNQESVNLFVIQ